MTKFCFVDRLVNVQTLIQYLSRPHTRVPGENFNISLHQVVGLRTSPTQRTIEKNQWYKSHGGLSL